MGQSPSKGGSDVTSVVDGYNESIITLEGSKLLANGHMFLSDVPDNITVTPSPYSSTEKSISTVGSFLGFDTIEPNSRHVVPIGNLVNIRSMIILGLDVWWTTHWVGSNGADLKNETQKVILDKSDSGRPYILLLPLIEGPFRATLQLGNEDNVDICVESGSTKVSGASFRSVLYVHAGDDPFNLVEEAMKVMGVYLGTSRLLEEKTLISEFDKVQVSEPEPKGEEPKEEQEKKPGLLDKLHRIRNTSSTSNEEKSGEVEKKKKGLKEKLKQKISREKKEDTGVPNEEPTTSNEKKGFMDKIKDNPAVIFGIFNAIFNLTDFNPLEYF